MPHSALFFILILICTEELIIFLYRSFPIPGFDVSSTNVTHADWTDRMREVRT